jgi:acyl-CoA synthetase (NDP forming)
VAVIGASGDRTRIGGLIVDELKRFAFPGSVFPINPKYEEIHGFACYPSLADVPGNKEIDVAILYLKAEVVPDVIRECGERGVRGVVIITSGFAEVGAEGAALERRVVEEANRFDMAVCGPNCAGLANFNENFVAYGTTNFIDLNEVKKGSVALLSASGGLGNTVFTYCQERRVGISHLIGLGNEAVTTSADFLGEFAYDDSVSIMIGIIEAIRNPVGFFRAVDQAAAANKPIILLKGGRSEAGRHAIMTHTASLGGSAEAYAGAFRKHGVVQVRDLDELADCAMLFSRAVPTTGNRLGVFSLPGGGTALVSDLAADYGFVVPDLEGETVEALREILPPIAVAKNPLDPTAGFGRNSEQLQTAMKIFAEDSNVDILVFFPLASQVEYSQTLADSLVAVAHDIAKPVLCIWTAGHQLEAGPWRTLHEAGIPLFTQTEPCFRALQKFREYAQFCERRSHPEASDYGSFATKVKANLEPSGLYVQELLSSFGIAFPNSGLAKSASEAGDLYERFSVPVAMKVVSKDVVHKTDSGGVRIGIDTADGARDAFESIIDSVSSHHPRAAIDGVEVQEMAPEGIEMLLGVTSDDQLGPILTVGLGGVMTEVLRDVSMRTVPVSRVEVRKMLEELRGSALLRGFRGSPPADVEALVDAILGLSALADTYRSSNPEIDLNPVIVGQIGGGVTAVDAVVQLDGVLLDQRQWG